MGGAWTETFQSPPQEIYVAALEGGRSMHGNQTRRAYSQQQQERKPALVLSNRVFQDKILQQHSLPVR